MSKSRPDVSKMTDGFFITINSRLLHFKHIIHIDDFPLNGPPPCLYYYSRAVRKNLSSKFDVFLAGGLNSTTIMASISMRIHVANPRPLDRLLRLIDLFFTIFFNNVAFRPRRVVYAVVFVLDVATDIRQINR